MPEPVLGNPRNLYKSMKPIRALRCQHYLIPTLDSNSRELYANVDLTAFTGLTLIHLSLIKNWKLTYYNH